MPFLLLLAWAAAAPLLHAASPFAGRWNFTVNMPNGGTRASWLGITEKDGALEVWYQPTGGNVYRIDNPKTDGNKLLLTLRSGANAASWELESAGKDKLTGVWKRGGAGSVTPLEGTRAPELRRPMPKAWTRPEPIFNGKDLTGWEPIGTAANSHWMVKDGTLVNATKGANLRTKATYQDFRLHFEVNYPDHANSGFYLRGRYELQLESEPLAANPPERRIGSIYGRIAPKGDLPRYTDVWDTFDVTLVGRTLTVIRNGVMTMEAVEIEGPTGGAINGHEAEPGPFYIQGDHTGGLQFRNITVSVPQGAR
ncbi:MAG: DUF1080 domain-containing protein [Bryobacterales bacterium]|nr:DUF1080 domain-containing protein [Bryobacterales bacterium]